VNFFKFNRIRISLELKKSNIKFTNLVSWGVFLPTLAMLIISLISAIFPNLLLSSFGGVEDHLNINPFETGIWAFPLLLTNFIVFGLAVLYQKQRLPNFFTSLIKFIFNFEISSKITFLVIVILIGMYIIFSVGELFDGKFQPDYNERVKGWIENFSFTEIEGEGLNAPNFGSYLHIVLGIISIHIFDNVKVIPFISSIALLILTYFFTVQITSKKFAGIIAMVIVLQSGVFLMYDTGITYPNFWILLYLLSLYLIFKKWWISPIAYVTSILTKSLTAAFLPMTLFFVYRSEIPHQKKIRVLILYGIIVMLGILFLNLSNSSLIGGELGFGWHDFWAGFNAIHSSLRLDGLVLLFLLPLVVGLFLASNHGFRQADSIIFLILGIMLSAVLMPAFSDVINVPYRFVPLVVFFAIGIGVLLRKKVTE